MIHVWLFLLLNLSERPAAEPVLKPPSDHLDRRFAPPAGFLREPAPAGSFAAWLRSLPLREPGAPVRLHDGRLKINQDAHVAVVDLDIGSRDLQQCADAVMRLRAEWLFSQNRFQEIHFNLTNGMRVDYARWRAGERVKVQGNKTWWEKSKPPCSTYTCFRAYLDFVFTYAGTHSLSRELRSQTWSDLQPGDVIIQGGSPGHAVLVADIAHHPHTGEKVFLLLQSYMPAQDIQVLKNPNNAALNPWYSAKCYGSFPTPEWDFTCNALKTW